MDGLEVETCNKRNQGGTIGTRESPKQQAWLETELRTPAGGFMFGRATDTGGNIEGLHDQPDSPAGLLVDECKSIRPEVLDALSRCHTNFRLFMSSTGPAFGEFYHIMSASNLSDDVAAK